MLTEIVSCNSLMNGLMHFICVYVYIFACDTVHQDETQINY